MGATGMGLAAMDGDGAEPNNVLPRQAKSVAGAGPASTAGEGDAGLTAGEIEALLPARAEVTRLLGELTGSAAAADELLPLLYNELRRLAASALGNERHERTLDATSLVHEAYLRLVASVPERSWDGRRHFFAAAAITMRRILVERARRRSRLKHGGGRVRLQLDEGAAAAEAHDLDGLLSLDDALSELERVSPRRAQVVMLRYFAGLTIEETAAALGIAAATVKEDWVAARAWLRRRIEGRGPVA